MSKGLKIDNSQSQFSVKPDRVKELEKKAEEAVGDEELYKNRAWELAVRYKSFIEDSKLKENKSSIVLDIEKETIDSLISLASSMNKDENQPEGEGSNALCMLLLKCMLIQRDKINDLNYRISNLEKNKTDETKG